MSDNPIVLKGIHHVELWVGNARQAAYYYRKAFGMSQLAYCGLETGRRDRTSYLLGQNQIRLVLTSPLQGGGPINDHLNRHGDGVRDIAFAVDDVDQAFRLAVERGANAAEAPHDESDARGTVRRAAIKTYGETLHSFIGRRDYRGVFLPGFEEQRVEQIGCGLELVDHIVGNVEQGRMDHWAEWYSRVFGFHRYITFDDKDISTEFSALQSVVMSDDNHLIKFPINEPAEARRRSQIQEYLDFYDSAGVQHVALLTRNIVATAQRMMDSGVEFLAAPGAYYDTILDRVGPIDEPLNKLEPLGILIDNDENGYLLQIFTRPVQDRPTLFFEVIQRQGARGFGKGNFKALFEAIEREQDRRGNL